MNHFNEKDEFNRTFAGFLKGQAGIFWFEVAFEPLG
jgi:hypothetical protein